MSEFNQEESNQTGFTRVGGFTRNNDNRQHRLYPRFVVTRNGAIALYNLSRDPIILYADQWEKLSSLIRRDILDNYMAKNTHIIKRRQPRGPNTFNQTNTDNTANDGVGEDDTVEVNEL